MLKTGPFRGQRALRPMGNALKPDFSPVLGSSGLLFTGVGRSARGAGRPLRHSGQERVLGDDEIDECKEHLQLRGVLLEAPVLQLPMPKAVLDDVKRMPDPRPQASLELVDGLGEELELAVGHLDPSEGKGE